MKAREYAEQYKDQPGDETIRQIVTAMLLETKELIAKRGVKTNTGLFGILDELIAKYKAFVNAVGDPNLRPDGMNRIVEKEMPEVYTGWQEYKLKTKTRRRIERG